MYSVFPTEFVIVHNGIITNYKDIKKFLVRSKYHHHIIISDTNL